MSQDTRMPPDSKQVIELTVDEEVVQITVRPHQPLVDALRDGCGRTSVKQGCESAGCGACTVLIDGQPTLSCITLAVDAVGRKIMTAEGLSSLNGPLHPVQKAFVEHHAIQCGFCTPGMLLSAVALLESNANPNEEDVRAAIAGNLCRCTGYIRIVQAIIAASQATSPAVKRRLTEGA